MTDEGIHGSFASALDGSGQRANKYSARKTGGYASKKEYRRANELKQMESAGLISDLQEQVAFTLLPTQRDKDGELLEKACKYIADFVYRDGNGTTVVEDTKGMRTAEYIIKRKLMLYMRGIRIKEI